MKVLYANPVFLDYRLPFYKELNKLFEGSFHILYSKQRYMILRKEKLYERIKQELGENAHPLTTDYLFDTHSMSFHMKDIEQGQHIPITFGLLRSIRKIRPEVIITEGFFQWTPMIILYSLLFRVPVFMGYERTCYTERRISIFKRWHRKLTDKFISGYLVNGSETRKYLRTLGIPDQKIHTGGMNADSQGLVDAIARFPQEERAQFRRSVQPNEGLVYLFVGRLTPLKGVSELLEAWGEHIRTHTADRLILIGTGALLEACRMQYAEEESILIAGGIDYAEVYKYYAVADVFILPTMEDNWSLVVPEAMACGLPVATSIYNGCHPELVRKENGLVFDSHNRKEIVATLAAFHRCDLKAMGQKSQEIEREFSATSCAMRVFHVIQRHD